MSIYTKIVIIDTNIITDLDNCQLLDIFIKLDNVYMCDLVKNDEINEKTTSKNVFTFIKCLSLDENMFEEVIKLSMIHRKLSFYDLANYVIAKNYNGILATGDERLRRFVIENGIEVIRTLKIIETLFENKIINKEKLLHSLDLLLENEKTRIPKEDIKKLKEKYADLVAA